MFCLFVWLSILLLFFCIDWRIGGFFFLVRCLLVVRLRGVQHNHVCRLPKKQTYKQTNEQQTNKQTNKQQNEQVNNQYQTNMQQTGKQTNHTTKQTNNETNKRTKQTPNVVFAQAVLALGEQDVQVVPLSEQVRLTESMHREGLFVFVCGVCLFVLLFVYRFVFCLVDCSSCLWFVCLVVFLFFCFVCLFVCLLWWVCCCDLFVCLVRLYVCLLFVCMFV